MIDGAINDVLARPFLQPEPRTGSGQQYEAIRTVLSSRILAVRAVENRSKQYTILTKFWTIETSRIEL
jgi:hypothetical protein